MTTLYRPVLIESAEQAEALPEGTVALQSWGHGTTARTLTNGRWIAPSGATLPHAEAIGFTALLPIKAEEEWTAAGTEDGEEWSVALGFGGLNGERSDAEGYTKTFGGNVVHRLVTPWEAE